MVRDQESHITTGEGKDQRVEPKPYVESPRFGSYFQKHGVYDGKLFHTHDKVTYTFVTNEEVISIHFDRTRKTIFYKGHNISNIDLNPEQQNYLEQFKEALERNADTTSFVGPYVRIYQAYLKDHPT